MPRIKYISIKIETFEPWVLYYEVKFYVQSIEHFQIFHTMSKQSKNNV